MVYTIYFCSIFLPPSAHALTPGGEIAGEVNPTDIRLGIENDDGKTLTDLNIFFFTYKLIV